MLHIPICETVVVRKLIAMKLLRSLFASGKENKFSVGLFLSIKYIMNGLHFKKP